LSFVILSERSESKNLDSDTEILHFVQNDKKERIVILSGSRFPDVILSGTSAASAVEESRRNEKADPSVRFALSE
jgi:hypothetical protein